MARPRDAYGKNSSRELRRPGRCGRAACPQDAAKPVLLCDVRSFLARRRTTARSDDEACCHMGDHRDGRRVARGGGRDGCARDRPAAGRASGDPGATVAVSPAIPDAKPPAISLGRSEPDGTAAAAPPDPRPVVTGSIPVPLGPDRREAARVAPPAPPPAPAVALGPYRFSARREAGSSGSAARSRTRRPGTSSSGWRGSSSFTNGSSTRPASPPGRRPVFAKGRGLRLVSWRSSPPARRPRRRLACVRGRRPLRAGRGRHPAPDRQECAVGWAGSAEIRIRDASRARPTPSKAPPRS